LQVGFAMNAHSATKKMTCNARCALNPVNRETEKMRSLNNAQWIKVKIIK